MLQVTVSDHAHARAPGPRRWGLIVAGAVALLGSLAVAAPAQAGYYGGYGYGYRPCSYNCGYTPYRYGCSACGCYRHCYSGSRGLVYERRYIEREYVERRYGCCRHHYGYRHYGYYPYGGYRSWSRPFPWGYGGVRSWRAPRYGRQAPYGNSGYEPTAERYGYEEQPPRPPAPVWGEGYE